MTFEPTPNSQDLEYFCYLDHPQPVRIMEPPIEIHLYHITRLEDISSTRRIHHCIGKKGNGLLAKQCKAALSYNALPPAISFPKTNSEVGHGWDEAEYLVNLARRCLCEQCCATQLSDVVFAWVEELEHPVDRVVRRTDSVVDVDEMEVLSRIAEIAPVKSLVAASVATRDLVSKVWGLWT